MATQVSLDVVTEARAKMASGDVAGAWRTLAEAGDTYAKWTARVTDASQPSMMRTLVESLWDTTAGAEVRTQKWDAVAQRHLTNYLDKVSDLGGRLPDSKFIEGSYRDSLIFHDVPTTAAVDLVLNALTSPVDQVRLPSLNRFLPGPCVSIDPAPRGGVW